MLTTLLISFTFLAQADEPCQLPIYILTTSGASARSSAHIDVSCEMYPTTLSVGDVMYARITVKNITDIPLESYHDAYTHQSVGRSFSPLVWVRRNSSGEFCRGTFAEMVPIYGKRVGISDSRPFTPAPPRPSQALPGRVLKPGETETAFFRPFFVPIPDVYDEPVWTWDDLAKEEKMLLGISTSKGTRGVSEETSPRRESCNIHIVQELKIKQRPKEKQQLIKEWHDKTWSWSEDNGTFHNLWYTDEGKTLTAEQWREFEEKLTPGTLRNYIRVNRTLVEIAQDENKGKRQELFNEMLKWFDTLHPLEKEGLTKRAYEIVRRYESDSYRVKVFGHEITVPVAAE